MKRWQWVLLGILTYLIFLVLYLPAGHVSQFIQEKSNNAIVFDNVEGTALNGTSSNLVVQGIRLNNVNWSVSAAPLLMGKLSVDVEAGAIRTTEQIYLDSTVSTSLFNTQRITLSNTQIFVPAKTLLSNLKLPVVVTAQGRLRADINTFEYDQGCVELQGTGNWLQAQININSNPLELGTFDASLSCEPPAFMMQISPNNGLSLNANIKFDPSGEYSAKGSFAIPSNFPRELKQGAQFFGEPDGNGQYLLNLKGKL